MSALEAASTAPTAPSIPVPLYITAALLLDVKVAVLQLVPTMGLSNPFRSRVQVVWGLGLGHKILTPDPRGLAAHEVGVTFWGIKGIQSKYNE